MSTIPARKEGPSETEAGLTEDALLGLYRSMVLARALDARWLQLNRQGKASLYVSSQGHEALHLGTIAALDRSRDYFFTYYRDMAALVALGLTPVELLLGFMAKAGEPMSGARQLPVHGAYPSKHFFNLSNVVAAQVPKAVGAALALKMRREQAVVAVFFGDGATSEGEWHEAMNFAGIHRLPVVFVCENNDYAISVPRHLQMAIANVADRAAGYGFPGVTIDGSDLFAVHREVAVAAERALRGEGPTLVEGKVERLMPHTSDDDDRRYRPPEELERVRQRDPLPRLRDYLLDKGLLPAEKDTAILGDAQREVDEATDAAEKAPFPDPATLLQHVYEDGHRAR